jgi:hypothetical protein
MDVTSRFQSAISLYKLFISMNSAPCRASEEGNKLMPGIRSEPVFDLETDTWRCPTAAKG